MMMMFLCVGKSYMWRQRYGWLPLVKLADLKRTVMWSVMGHTPLCITITTKGITRLNIKCHITSQDHK